MGVCVEERELSDGLVLSCDLGMRGRRSLWMGEAGTYWMVMDAMDERGMYWCWAVVEERMVE